MNYPLSPIDHVFTGPGSYPIEFAFFYPSTLDEGRLRAGLERTLEAGFHPVRSRLSVMGDGNRLALQTDPDGIRMTIRESSDEAVCRGGKEIRPYLDHVRTVPGEPLTGIRLTRTPRGTVLGLSMSHAIADGYSYFYFLSEWAKSTRGEVPVRKPFVDRSVIASALFGGEQTANEPPRTESKHPHGFFPTSHRADPRPEDVEWDCVRWSKAELDELVDEGRRTSSVRLTYNDVVTAHLWRTYVPRWRPPDADPSTPTTICCPVDFRRLVRALSRNYFGNAVCLATAEMSYEGLATSAPGDLAERIHRAVAGTRAPHAARTVAALEATLARSGAAGPQSLQVMDPNHGLLVTNLSRVPLNDLDFGSGPPDGIAVGTPVHRGALVLPAPDGIAVHIAHPMTGGNR